MNARVEAAAKALQRRTSRSHWDDITEAAREDWRDDARVALAAADAEVGHLSEALAVLHDHDQPCTGGA